MKKSVFGLLMLFVLSSCRTSEMPVDPTDVQLGQTFVVPYSRTVTIDREQIKISFTELNDDSRCPKGAVCVWGGSATIALRLSQGSEEDARLSIGTGQTNINAIAYKNYTIRLIELNPYPGEEGASVPISYKATLLVTKN